MQYIIYNFRYFKPCSSSGSGSFHLALQVFPFSRTNDDDA